MEFNIIDGPKKSPWLGVVYGPGGCISGDAFIRYEVRNKSGERQNSKGGSLENLYKRFNGIERKGKGFYQRKETLDSVFYVQSVSESDNKILLNEVKDVIDSGIKEVYELITESGLSLKATPDHEFLTPNGYVALEKIKVGDSVLISNGLVKKSDRKPNYYKEVFVKYHKKGKTKIVNGCTYYRVKVSHAAYEAKQNDMLLQDYIKALNTWEKSDIDLLYSIPNGYSIHHIDRDHQNNNPENLLLVTESEHQRLHREQDGKLSCISNHVEPETVKSINYVGYEHTYDIVCADPYRNFIANKIVVHNCGKSWLCSHSPDPFYIPVEPGTDLIPAKKIDHLPVTFDELVEMLRFAVKSVKGMGCQTVVIDSLGFVESLIYTDILTKNPTTEGKDPKPVSSIADYGFGRGYAKAMTYWAKILSACDALQARGVNVILITHSHYKNIQTDGGDSYKYIDMALQTFGDYSVPELLKRRADWVYYMESKVQTISVKQHFSEKSKKIAAPGTKPETIIHTRATSQYYAKVRTLDESAIPDYYVLERATLAEDSKRIFNDLER